MYSLNVTTSRSRRWPAYHAAAQELVFHNCPFQDTSQGCTHTRGLQYRDRHNLTQQPTYFSLPGIYIPGAHPSHMPLPEAAMDLLVLRQSDCMIIAGYLVVQELLVSSLVPTTHKTYRWGETRYLSFCRDAGLTSLSYWRRYSRNVLEAFISCKPCPWYHQILSGGSALWPNRACSRNLFIHVLSKVVYILKEVKKATPWSTHRHLHVTPNIQTSC